MELPSPSKRKPTASEVVEWALTIAKNKTSINVDGRLGAQCWDLPNFILKNIGDSLLGEMLMRWLVNQIIEDTILKFIKIQKTLYLKKVIGQYGLIAILAMCLSLWVKPLKIIFGQ
ncbi:hypothetical protein [Staphylococcus shinii]|uniref:hypothetical protein n=1 Tax=Staphylococcus shinii TaxID=2912228 RepID=UPI003F57A745